MQRDEAFLLDMLLMTRRAAEHAARVEGDGPPEDPLVQDALVHVVQVLGEAARRISPEFKAAHPEIPWGEIVGMRHRLVHEYLDIDHALVWGVVKNELPKLAATLERLVE